MASRNSVLAAIVLGGLVAGTVDIGAAMLISGKSMAFVLQFIASGAVGKSAFDGGAGTVVLGALLQWAMSLIIAAIFVLASLRLLAKFRAVPPLAIWLVQMPVGCRKRCAAARRR